MTQVLRLKIDNMKCDFVTYDGMHFKCKNCNVELFFPEYQLSEPIYVCSKSISKDSTMPNFIKKIKNFVLATFDHIALGAPMCDEDTISKRYDICLKCENFHNHSCKLCGCPLKQGKNYISKLAWADQKCPINKW